MQPLWLHSGSEKAMPVNLTLKNVPDEVYERLKHSAALHRRSLNSEAILCLEMAIVPTSIPPAERLARARALRATLPQKRYSVKNIHADKQQGRP
jgi:plasmid stability protein